MDSPWQHLSDKEHGDEIVVVNAPENTPWNRFEPGGFTAHLLPEWIHDLFLPAGDDTVVDVTPEPTLREKHKALLRDPELSKAAKDRIKRTPVPTEIVPAPTHELRRTITPSNYDAIEIHGFFGVIDSGPDAYNDRMVVVHTPLGMDRSHMLSLRVGDAIPVVFLRKQEKGSLEIKYITRSQYFAPGRSVSSMRLGVDGWPAG